VERAVVATASTEDERFDRLFRPTSLDEYIGQEQHKENLRVFVEAARRREEPLDHVLLCGPPGLGKTTLAYILAREMGVSLHLTSGPAVEHKGALAGLLTKMEANDVLFIDEIHRLSKAVEEVLYPAMEDSKIDIVIGKGPSARSIRLDLPHFTLIGATTRIGLVAGPLRDRFGFVGRVDLYETEDLQSIVERSARLLEVAIDEGGSYRIAERSRGTPRIANRLLRRVRDFVEVRGDGTISQEAADEGLTLFGVDHLGLDKLDRMILEVLCVRFGGQPVGLSTLAQSVGEEQGTIEDAHEPFLVQRGLVHRTPRGRVATPAAFAHLGVTVATATTNLFTRGNGDPALG
jgi:Holliday junction DNA helicase RuvB